MCNLFFLSRGRSRQSMDLLPHTSPKEKGWVRLQDVSSRGARGMQSLFLADTLRKTGNRLGSFLLALERDSGLFSCQCFLIRLIKIYRRGSGWKGDKKFFSVYVKYFESLRTKRSTDKKASFSFSFTHHQIWDKSLISKEVPVCLDYCLSIQLAKVLVVTKVLVDWGSNIIFWI